MAESIYISFLYRECTSNAIRICKILYTLVINAPDVPRKFSHYRRVKIVGIQKLNAKYDYELNATSSGTFARKAVLFMQRRGL